MLVLLGETVTLTADPLPIVRYNVVSPRSAFGKSVTFTVKLKEPAVVGAPEMVPVVLFKDKPGGRP
jgi:hypothetical protein